MIKKQLLFSIIFLFFFCLTSLNAQTEKRKQPLIEILEKLHSDFECNFSYIDNDVRGIFVEPPDNKFTLKRIYWISTSQHSLIIYHFRKQVYNHHPKRKYIFNLRIFNWYKYQRNYWKSCCSNEIFFNNKWWKRIFQIIKTNEWRYYIIQAFRLSNIYRIRKSL